MQKVPIMRPTKFTHEMNDILGELSQAVNSKETKEVLPRLHKDNLFNKRFSVALSSFSDLKALTERLEESIKESIDLGRQMQAKEGIDQKLHRSFDRVTPQLKVDLKSLYVYSKIFLDDYIKLIRFVLDWRGVEDRSVTAFYNSLSKYKGNDPEVFKFTESCLNRLKAVDVYVTGYRDDAVVHNHGKHKQDTEWFMNFMNGEIRFMGGSRPSITPQEILFITKQFIDCSNSYIQKWLDQKLGKTV